MKKGIVTVRDGEPSVFGLIEKATRGCVSPAVAPGTGTNTGT